jgi:hypothetical protein
MSPFGRVVVVALLLCLPAMSDGAAGRDGKRDFPNFAKCPVHTGSAGQGDKLVFTAQYPSATLTFLACDYRGPDSEFSPLDLWIDDLMVVDRAYFNAHQVAFAEKQAEYGFQADCYQGTPVDTVFDRRFTLPRTRTMPLVERFENGRRGWNLVNAQVKIATKGAAPLSGALILADSALAGLPGSQRSMASVRLTNLTRGREYVVDFSWFAAGFDQDQDILTVALDDGSPGSGAVTTQSLLLPVQAAARGSAAAPPR